MFVLLPIFNLNWTSHGIESVAGGRSNWWNKLESVVQFAFQANSGWFFSYLFFRSHRCCCCFLALPWWPLSHSTHNFVRHGLAIRVVYCALPCNKCVTKRKPNFGLMINSLSHYAFIQQAESVARHTRMCCVCMTLQLFAVSVCCLRPLCVSVVTLNILAHECEIVIPMIVIYLALPSHCWAPQSIWATDTFAVL